MRRNPWWLLGLTLACSGAESDPERWRTGNGEARLLTLGGPILERPLPVRAPVLVDIERARIRTDCTEDFESGTLCSSEETLVALSLESAVCEGIGCQLETVSEPLSGRLQLRVRAERAGEGVLRIAVRDPSGRVLEDSWPVRALTIDSITLTHAAAADMGSHYAGFAGAVLYWDLGLLGSGDAGAARLAQTEGTVAVSLDGRAVASTHNAGPTELRLVAVEPGTTTLRLDAAEFHRAVELHVVDAVAVRSIELVPVDVVPNATVEVGTDVLASRAGVDAIRLNVSERENFALRARLEDGTEALGGAGRVTFEPPGIVGGHRVLGENVYTEPSAQAFLRLAAEMPGRTVLVARIGSVERRVPIEVAVP